MARRKSIMTYPDVERMVLGWPGVELSQSYGRPSLKVKGKFFTWVKEDGDSLAIGGIDFDERDMLMETQGDVFYITDHYRNSRYVLMRLSKADPATVEAFLRRRWHAIAPKTLHAAFGTAPKSAKPDTRKTPASKTAAKIAPAKTTKKKKTSVKKTTAKTISAR
jgi:hypothetical protein